MGAKFMGARVKRLEDQALLTGKGEYTDDIDLPGALHAVFVRSPHPHARFTAIDGTAAEAMDGVYGVFTLADFPAEIQNNRLLLLLPNPAITQPMMPYLLAASEVHFVGEPVAVVVARTRHRLGAPAGNLGCQGCAGRGSDPVAHRRCQQHRCEIYPAIWRRRCGLFQGG